MYISKERHVLETKLWNNAFTVTFDQYNAPSLIIIIIFLLTNPKLLIGSVIN